MKRKRFKEEQIAFALRQAELGTPVEEIYRKIGAGLAPAFTAKAKPGVESQCLNRRKKEGIGKG